MKNKGLIVLLVGLASLSLIVLVALFFFYPKDTKGLATPAAQVAPSTVTGVPAVGTPDPNTVPNEFDPVEWTRNPTTTPINPPAAGTPGQSDFLVTLPPANTPGKTSTLPNSPGATFPGDLKSKGTAPQNVPSTAVTKPIAEKTKETKPVKPVVAKVTKKVKEFWIQVGSYKDRYQAENTAKSLESQGLKGTLFTASVAGQNVVRVRVGPYTNQEEAQKFLAWIKPVKGFDGSYITSATALRAE